MKTKKTIEELDKIICKELGKRNTAVYNQDDHCVVEVPEDNYDDAVELIEDAGWKIINEDWFSGSSYDGCAFHIKQENSMKKKQTMAKIYVVLYVSSGEVPVEFDQLTVFAHEKDAKAELKRIYTGLTKDLSKYGEITEDDFGKDYFTVVLEDDENTTTYEGRIFTKEVK